MIAFYDGFDVKIREIQFSANAESYANANEKSYKLNDEGPLDPMTIYDEGTGLGHWDNDTQLAAAKTKKIAEIREACAVLLANGILYNSNLFVYDIPFWLSWEKRVDLGIVTFPSSVYAIDGTEEVISNTDERTTFIATIFQKIHDLVDGGDDLIKNIIGAPNFTSLGAISDART